MSPRKAPLIAIIDDDEDLATYTGAVLKKAFDCECRVEPDGISGLSYCLRERPDLICLDLDMPGLRGEDVCRVLKISETHRNTPIIVISGISDSRQKEMQVLGIGADAYLSKPFRDIDLTDKVRDLLSRDASTPATRPPGEERTVAVARSSDSSDTPATSPAYPRMRAAEVPFGGQIFAGCEIIRVIGQGGMGTVYHAVQLSVNRHVALKVLLNGPSLDQEVLWRFDQEARIMARLDHPGIVRVYDFGRTPLTSYIIMELVPGGSLADWKDSGKLSEMRADVRRRMAFEICRAIAYLHSQGVIHRDIKPGNVLMTREGVVKMADFGVSRVERGTGESTHSGLQTILGTPRFMAPEQKRGTEASERTDIYSLGLTLDILLGTGLFGERCEDLQKNVTDFNSMIVRRCCAKHPEDRPKSVKEVEVMLRAGSEPRPARPT